jgi:hypothetical protein
MKDSTTSIVVDNAAVLLEYTIHNCVYNTLTMFIEGVKNTRYEPGDNKDSAFRYTWHDSRDVNESRFEVLLHYPYFESIQLFRRVDIPTVFRLANVDLSAVGNAVKYITRNVQSYSALGWAEDDIIRYMFESCELVLDAEVVAGSHANLVAKELKILSVRIVKEYKFKDIHI